MKNSFPRFNFNLLTHNIFRLTGDNKILFLRDYLKILLQKIPIFIYDVDKLVKNLCYWYNNTELSIDLTNYVILNKPRELFHLEYLYNLVQQNSKNMLVEYSFKFKNRNIFLLFSLLLCIIYFSFSKIIDKKRKNLYGRF